MKNNLINIITRTSNRPNGFKINREWLTNQTYSNFNHIVCVDDPESLSYVEKEGYDILLEINREKIIFEDESINPNTGKYSPHNLYMNVAHKHIKDGWVMYLDDDDRFNTLDALEIINNKINEVGEDTIIYWQMVYSNGSYLPNVINSENPPILGGIGSPCFTFNYKHLGDLKWDGWKCGDYRFISKLHDKIPNNTFLNKKLIYIPKANMGNRKDIIK